MQRKGKTSFTKAKSKLLCYLLSGALLFGNLMVFETVSVSAAESTQQDNGNQETLQPKVIVSSYDELVQAIDESEDGDVIGIDRIIELNSDVSMLGDAEKRITVCRMSENGYFLINSSASVTVSNIFFNGNASVYDRCYVPMFQVEGKIDFENVTFQNCYNNWSGGAIAANGGEMNITGCHSTNNRADEGGHIVVQSAKVSVQNSIFENGIAENGGGAVKVELIYGYDNEIEFNNCRLVGNQAKFGGAVANKGNVKITSSVIYGNQAKSAADIINYVESSFQIDSIEEMMELYKEVGIVPKEWIYDYDNKSYINGEIDKTNPNAALKLVYEEIPDEAEGSGDTGTGDSSDDNNSQNRNDSLGKDESKGDTAETEQPKDDSNRDNSAADSEKGNDNKGNDDTENNKNQENQENQDNVGNDVNKDGSSSDSDKKDIEDSNNMPDTSAGNGNQTSNQNTQKPNIDNGGSASDITPPSSEGNKQPDNTISNENQSGTSDGNIGNNSSNNNQNQPSKPVSGVVNNTTNGNASGNTNSGSGSSTGNNNINTGASQNGENELSKPEDSKDNNSGSSDNGGTVAIADDSPNTASDSDDGSSDKATVNKKKSIKKLNVTAKKGKRKITGKTIKKATIKIRIGKKIYKVESDTKGKFTIKLKGKAKLKKGQKVKVIVSKKGYKTKSKIFKVK